MAALSTSGVLRNFTMEDFVAFSAPAAPAEIVPPGDQGPVVAPPPPPTGSVSAGPSGASGSAEETGATGASGPSGPTEPAPAPAPPPAPPPEFVNVASPDVVPDGPSAPS